jgi:hypothetical protein
MTAAALPTRRHAIYFFACVVVSATLFLAGALANSMLLQSIGVITFTSISFMLLGAVIGNYIHVMIASRKDFASYDNINNPTTIEWDQKHVHVRTNKGDLKVEWGDLLKLTDKMGMLLFYFQRQVCFILPKRHLHGDSKFEEIKRLFIEARKASR